MSSPYQIVLLIYLIMVVNVRSLPDSPLVLPNNGGKGLLDPPDSDGKCQVFLISLTVVVNVKSLPDSPLVLPNNGGKCHVFLIYLTIVVNVKSSWSTWKWWYMWSPYITDILRDQLANDGKSQEATWYLIPSLLDIPVNDNKFFVWQWRYTEL